MAQRKYAIAPPREQALTAHRRPHRHAALTACQQAIDTLKQTVPIWKKERYADGEEWVSQGS